MFLDVADGDVARDEILLVHDATVQRNEVFHPGDDRLVQGCTHASNSILPVVAPRQEFGQQGIEAPRHLVAWVRMGVASDAEAGWEVTIPESAR